MTDTKHTVRDVWGFSDTLSVNADANKFMQRVDFHAKDRGIESNVPSDALDQSRMVILSDAARDLKVEWEVVGDTLRLWPVGLKINWDAVLDVAGS